METNLNKSYHKIPIIVCSLIIISIFVLGFLTYTTLSEEENVSSLQLSERYENKATGTLESGDVRIDLTPKGVINGRFVVEIGANTHSVDLSQFDLIKIITLEYSDEKLDDNNNNNNNNNNNKKTISPISASQLSGHHSYGEIVFDLDEKPQDFNIMINGIPKVDERVYKWGEE